MRVRNLQRPHRVQRAHRHIHRAGAVSVRQDHRHLLAAIARHQIFRPQDGARHRPGGLAQTVIAGLVPVGVVERLELVEVQKQHGQMILGALRAAPAAFQRFVEQPPVGQTRQPVRLRQDRELRRQLLLLGHVPQHDHELTRSPAGPVKLGFGVDFHPAQRAVLADDAKRRGVGVGLPA